MLSAVDICINARVLGTEKHLIRDEQGYSWQHSVPPGVWHLSGEQATGDRCLDAVFRLSHVTIDLLPPTQYVNAFRTLSSLEHPPWQKVMPTRAHRGFVEALVSQVDRTTADACFGFYTDTWVPEGDVLRSLCPAQVDVRRIGRLVNDDVGNKHVVATFLPDVHGTTFPVTYDRFSTVTGRLTVQSGPEILTLKREYRDIVVPSTPGGKVFSIDFSALEVRVMLYELGIECDDSDVYVPFANEFNMTRDDAKFAVISRLYEIGEHALGERLGVSGHALKELIARIDSRLPTETLLKRLRLQHATKGYITNRFGRRIIVSEPIDRIFKNYYAQSTGVDVALLGFSSIVNKLKASMPGVRPLFVLHDALILDVPREHIVAVEAIDTVRIAGYEQAFRVKASSFAQ
jgi:hypothetical protein